MSAPSARATTRHRQAEHTVVRAVSVTAATTAGQVTARSPSLNGAAPTCRARNHSTVTPTASRSNGGPKRRTAGPIPAGTEYKPATPVTRVGWTHSSTARLRQRSGRRPVAVNQRDRGPVVPMRNGSRWLGGAVRTIQPADEGAPPAIRPAGTGAPPAIRPAGTGALPTIRLATLLGLLATGALLGVVSATAGLGVAGWTAGLASGSAATALLVTARMRSDQPAMFPADWVTLTRALLIAGVAGLVADSFGRPVPVTALVTLSTVALVLDGVDGQVARRTGTATALGGRIDSEVDAFLILLLSVVVSQDYGG